MSLGNVKCYEFSGKEISIDTKNGNCKNADFANLCISRVSFMSCFVLSF